MVPGRVLLLVLVLVVWTKLDVVRFRTEEEESEFGERTEEKVSRAIWLTWVNLLGVWFLTFYGFGIEREIEEEALWRINWEV